MDAASDFTLADLALDETGRDLWEPALPHLRRALAGDDLPFLEALEGASRGAGLLQKAPVTAVLGAYCRGSERVHAALSGSGRPDAEQAARRLPALERSALARIAAGYAGGLTETIDRLRRLAEEASPLDADTGAIKPDAMGERLSLEVERCRRMDLSLGLLELSLEGRGAERSAGAARGRGFALHEVGDCLRENLRRYDSIGLTEEGDFLLVLPDISRRGLAGAAERIRRELGTCAGRGEPPACTFALAHYDYVDMSAREMLTGLSRGMEAARSGDQPLGWA